MPGVLHATELPSVHLGRRCTQRRGLHVLGRDRGSAASIPRRDFTPSSLIRDSEAPSLVRDSEASPARYQGNTRMHGLIGKMLAASGQRDALIAILLEGTQGMPGCLSYVIARDLKDDNAIWVTEVWDSKESHAASLQLPAVKAAIARGKPLIAGFGDYNVTEPVGGVGI